ncbi:MAG TPA: sulfate ABC transporter substrate-binding protein [Candidatus Dormibacteraeota bacterium]|nr:sulfate ABC transporter substrate-binding protein [Candidatus Dormibacteraeota bacterium]
MSSASIILPRRRFLTATAALLAAPGLAVLGASTADADSGPVNLSLVAYSTPKSAYAKLIAAYRKTAAGRNVTFSQSFAASGTQAKSVAAGLPADVVNFSLAPDMDSVVKAGKVAASWDKRPYNGMVTNSVVALVVRRGNPKHIHGWSDLTRSGIKVITPNPFSSGSARWNIMAAYGAQLKLGKSPTQARAYLEQLFRHIAVQDKSASDALVTFTGGEGDVLIDYEDDAIAAKTHGAAVDYVIPAETILIQNPIAVTSDSQHRAAAQSFVNYLTSSAGQKLWGQLGYRPVDPAVAGQFKFAKPAKLFDIGYLGGWSKVNTKFFDPTNGIVARIEQSVGVGTSSD